MSVCVCPKWDTQNDSQENGHISHSENNVRELFSLWRVYDMKHDLHQKRKSKSATGNRAGGSCPFFTGLSIVKNVY